MALLFQEWLISKSLLALKVRVREEMRKCREGSPHHGNVNSRQYDFTILGAFCRACLNFWRPSSQLALSILTDIIVMLFILLFSAGEKVWASSRPLAFLAVILGMGIQLPIYYSFASRNLAYEEARWSEHQEFLS